MLVYMTNIILVIILGALAEKYSRKKFFSTLNEEKKIPNLFFTFLLTASLMTLYALRWRVGTDFGAYYSSYFFHGNTSYSEVIGSRDWGFTLLTSFVYKVWPNNFVFYNYSLAALTYIPIVLTYRRYSNYFVFTLLLYILMMTYYWPFNGVRQSIAASICFVAFPFLLKKKYIHYIMVVLVAYLFHSTALLLIPIMLIVTKKAWSKPIWIALFFFFICFFTLPSIWGYMINFLEVIGQTKMADDYRNYKTGDDGANILRVAVVWMPIVVSFIYYKRLKEKNSQIDLLINMSLMCGIFMLFSSQLTVLARLSNYFIFFNALLIPEFSSLFNRKSRVLFHFITITLFLLYMFLLLPVDSSLLPYRFIFNRDK